MLGLAIWTVPVAVSLFAILDKQAISLGFGFLGAIVAVIGYGLIWYTRMEPDAVVISESEIYTEVGGGRRAEFPIGKITRVTLDGRGISLERPGRALILADRDFTPDKWCELKQALRDFAPGVAVHSTKKEQLESQKN